jgi:peptide/nickel transport system permease protein
VPGSLKGTQLKARLGPVGQFLARRLLLGAVTIWAISVISFTIIQLPPGDFVSNYIAQLSQSGILGSDEDVARLRADYGLDQPLYVRYASWAWNVLHGDFGASLDWGRPVGDLIAERIGPTLLVSLGGLLFSWLLALPIGFYSAVHRGSLGDYVFTSIGVIGLAMPSFLLALSVMYVGYRYFNVDLGALQSERFEEAPWSVAKAADLARHLLVPSAIIGFASSTRLIRVLRANLLDELAKPYVVTARAKGMREYRLLLKYPMRVALNPFVSSIGSMLPQLLSGSVVVSLVMSLPTLGPLLLRALQAQDMFLASTITLVLGVLTVIGTLISDLLLAWLDPRIRLNT